MILLAIGAGWIAGWKLGRASRPNEIEELATKLQTLEQLGAAHDRTENFKVSELRRGLVKHEDQKLENTVSEIIGLKTRTMVPSVEYLTPALTVSELDTMSPRTE